VRARTCQRLLLEVLRSLDSNSSHWSFSHLLLIRCGGEDSLCQNLQSEQSCRSDGDGCGLTISTRLLRAPLLLCCKSNIGSSLSPSCLTLCVSFLIWLSGLPSPRGSVEATRKRWSPSIFLSAFLLLTRKIKFYEVMRVLKMQFWAKPTCQKHAR
jgi:hypothetical protein